MKTVLYALKDTGGRYFTANDFDPLTRDLSGAFVHEKVEAVLSQLQSLMRLRGRDGNLNNLSSTFRLIRIEREEFPQTRRVLKRHEDALPGESVFLGVCRMDQGGVPVSWIGGGYYGNSLDDADLYDSEEEVMAMLEDRKRIINIAPARIRRVAVCQRVPRVTETVLS